MAADGEVGWEYEDALGDDVTDEQYDAMFPMSRVIGWSRVESSVTFGVRMFPFRLKDCHRVYITDPREMT